MSYKLIVTKLLLNLADQAAKQNPDSKHNTGRTIGEAFFWDEVMKFAKGKSDDAWKRLETQGVSAEPETPPGDHTLGVSPAFSVNLKVSEPRKAFNADALALKLNKSKYKVPVPIVKEMIEQAKIPTKSTFTYSIAERQ